MRLIQQPVVSAKFLSGLIINAILFALVACGQAVKPSQTSPNQVKYAERNQATDTSVKQSTIKQSVDDLLAVYASKSLAEFKDNLSPSMVGYAGLIDDVAQSNAALNQVRWQLSDTTIATNATAGVLTTKWQKRYLRATTSQAELREGTTSFTFDYANTLNQKNKVQSNHGQLTGLSGDNPFSAN